MSAVGWVCDICTLRNAESCRECEVCGGPRRSVGGSVTTDSDGDELRQNDDDIGGSLGEEVSIYSEESSTVSEGESLGIASERARDDGDGAKDDDDDDDDDETSLRDTDEDPDHQLALQLAMDEYQSATAQQPAKKKPRVHQSIFTSLRRQPVTPTPTHSLLVDSASSPTIVDLDQAEMKSLRLRKLIKRMDKLKAMISKNLVKPSKAANTLQCSGFLSQLLPHQVEGVQWLESLLQSNINGILADEMGLGKTLQVLYFLAHLFERHGVWGPHLIVVPLSVVTNWESEVRAHFKPGVFRLYTHYGAQADREQGFADFLRGISPTCVAVCLTTYDLVIRDQHLLKKLNSHTRKSRLELGYVVVDEGHRLKNKQSMLHRVLSNVRSQHRLLLTGTPIQNSFNELWALLTYLLPDTLHQEDDLLKWFNRPFEEEEEDDEVKPEERSDGLNKDATVPMPTAPDAAAMDAQLPESPSKRRRGTGAQRNRSLLYRLSTPFTPASYLTQEDKQVILTHIHSIITPFILRRLKQQVAKQLGKKVEKVVFCPYSPLQALLFTMFKEAIHNRWQAEAAETSDMPTMGAADCPATPDRRAGRRSGTREARSLQLQADNFLNATDSALGDLRTSSTMIQLRKLCNHPFLVLRDAAEADEARYERHLCLASGKMQVLHELLRRLLGEQRKVLVFSQMTRMLDILEDYLLLQGVSSVRLDGKMSRDDRQTSIRRFNASPAAHTTAVDEKHTPSVFLLSTRAGGLGLNLQAADTIIIYDGDYNPQADLQAIARAHRLNSVHKHSLLVLRLVTTHMNAYELGGKDIYAHAATASSRAMDLTLPLVHRDLFVQLQQSFSIEEDVYKKAFRKYVASKEVLRHGELEDKRVCVDDRALLQNLLLQDRAALHVADDCSAHTDLSESLSAGSSSSSSSSSSLSLCIEQASYAVTHSLDADADETWERLCDRSNGDLSLALGVTKVSVDADECLWAYKLHLQPAVPLLDEWAVDLAALHKRLRLSESWSAYRYIFRLGKERQLERRERGAPRPGPPSSEGALTRRRSRQQQSDFATETTTTTATTRDSESDGDSGGEDENNDSEAEELGLRARRGGDEDADYQQMRRPATKARSPRKARRPVKAAPALQDDDWCTLCGLYALSSLDLDHLRHELCTLPTDGWEGALTDDELTHTLIFCDGCDLTFHLACVGLLAAPEGEWYCRFCEVHPGAGTSISDPDR